jgi:uncharacterized protein (DUF58 family)
MLRAILRMPRGQATGRTVISTLFRSYLVLVLLSAVLTGTLLQTWIALVLLVLQGLMLYRPLPPRIDLPLTLATMLLAPLSLASLVSPFFAAALVLPGLPLLDTRLQDLAALQNLPPFQQGRRSGPTLRSLAAMVLAVGFLGVIAGSVTTLLVAAALFLGLVARLGYIFVATRDVPVKAESVGLRVLAGEEGHARFHLQNQAPFSLRIALSSPSPWLKLPRKETDIVAGAAEDIEVTVTPTLAGPVQPVIQALLLDPWGFLFWGIDIYPLRLHVIPRSRYAAWLARRYLEQTGRQQPVNADGLNRIRGVEYLKHRQYQPGDRLKDLDWRHIAKFREPIVKEYSEPRGGGIVILMNLVAGNAEEADWLGYHLITSALTAAREGLPSALTAYNHREAVLVTGSLHPRETLKHALRVSGEIALVRREERLLAPPNLLRLRRSVQNLRGNGSGGPRGTLGEVLQREIEALEDLARGHPLTSTLLSGLRGSPPPATITVISRWNHDAEALAVTLPRLQGQGYRVLEIGSRS